MMKRILLVDDTESSGWPLQVLLSEDFEVSLALSGKEAIENLQKKPYDMVLTDFSMPEMNGIELIKYVKPNFPQTKVILMSCYDLETIGPQAEAVGVELLDKFNIKGLIERVKEVLNAEAA